MSIRDRPRPCLRTDETSTRNQQTLQLVGNLRKHEWILPISEKIVRPR